MRVLLRIKTTEIYRRATQLRLGLSWSLCYIIGVGIMVGLVYLMTEDFER